jgi:cytochrome c oxidase subunit 1
MARRIDQYNPKFEAANQMSTAGAYILMTGWLIFLYMMLHAWRNGKIAPANPWHAKTLEWKVPTPVPLENFLVDPVVTSDPYTWGEGVPDGQGVPEVAPVEEPELVPAGSAPPGDGHDDGGAA